MTQQRAPIQLLDPHVADLIAAGEVVERPASVIKELVENAIDAGAHTVTVEIQNGGMALMRVADDGCGIPADQCRTAFLRHATSKLRTGSDLAAIGTLGFRGEALAAISSVSRMEVFTRTREEPLGTSLTLEGGKVTAEDPAGCPLGTTMVVRDLFFNTPARLKFMKRDAAEGAAVYAVVQKLALSHPEVSLKFIRDGKQELFTPGDGKLENTLYAVLGRDMALGFVPVSGGGEDVTVSGFASLPACCRGTRAYQHFFVNGRQVKSKLLTAALERAYENQKMVGKFPGCVLQLQVRPSQVDVNVHPAKTEVKFLYERKVFDGVYYTLLSALQGEDRHPEVDFTVGAPRTKAPAPDAAPAGKAAPLPGETKLSVPKGRPAPSAPLTETGKPAVKAGGFAHMTAGQFRDLHQVRDSAPATNLLRPISRETADSPPKKADFSPVIPDFSTDSSRNVEKTVDNVENPPSQPEKREASGAGRRERSPAPVPAPPAAEPEKAVAQEHLVLPGIPAADPAPAEPDTGEIPDLPPAWRLAGEVLNTYLIVEQGENVYLIDKHAAHERLNFDRMKAAGYRPMAQTLLAPIVLSPSPEEREVLLDNLPLLARFGFACEDFGSGAIVVREIPSDLDPGQVEGTLGEIAGDLLSGAGADPDSARDAVLHTMACKAAIKGGQKNSRKELLVVVRAVMSGQVKYCPHGRPVAITLTKNQLEKQFKRA